MPQALILWTVPPNLPTVGPVTNLTVGDVVTVTNDDIGGEITYDFQLVKKPVGSAAALAGAGNSRTFTPDVDGTYIVQLIVNSTFTDTQAGAVLKFPSNLREPAVSETTEFDPTNGWAETMTDIFDRANHGSGSKPAPSASVWGRIWHSPGDTAVPGPATDDVFEVCLKDNTDTYSWVDLVNAAASVTDGNNVGGGSEVFKTKTGTLLDFRTFLAGTNINVIQGTNEITIESTADSTQGQLNIDVTAQVDGIVDTFFIPNYEPGSLEVYRNGNKVRKIDIIELTSPSRVQLPTTPAITEKVEVFYTPIGGGIPGKLNEDVTAQVDGITDTFTIPDYELGSVEVYRNGNKERKSDLIELTGPSRVQLPSVPFITEKVEVLYTPLGGGNPAGSGNPRRSTPTKSVADTGVQLTVAEIDYKFLKVDTSGGATTLPLPDGDLTINGLEIIFKRDGGNLLTISASGAGVTINGLATAAVADGATLHLIYTHADLTWNIIG